MSILTQALASMTSMRVLGSVAILGCQGGWKRSPQGPIYSFGTSFWK